MNDAPAADAIQHTGDARRVDGRPATSFIDVESVVGNRLPDDEWLEFRSLWLRRILHGELSPSANEPPCIVHVLPLRGAVAVLFGAPVSLFQFVGEVSADGVSAPVNIRRRIVQLPPGATRAALQVRLEWLAGVIRRWSVIDRVRVVDLTDEAVSIAVGLAAAGLPAVTVVPEMVDLSVRRDLADDDLEDGHPAQWRVVFRYPPARHPWLEESFGDDVGSLVRFLKRLRPAELVPVRANTDNLERLVPILHRAGIAWCREP